MVDGLDDHVYTHNKIFNSYTIILFAFLITYANNIKYTEKVQISWLNNVQNKNYKYVNTY